MGKYKNNEKNATINTEKYITLLVCHINILANSTSMGYPYDLVLLTLM